MTDYDRIGQALKLYADETRRYVLVKLKAHHGDGRGWLEAYLGSFRSKHRQENVATTLQRIAEQGGNPEEIFDIVHLKDLLLAHQEVFANDFKRSLQRAATWADEIAEVRHKQAHQQDIPVDDVTRTLDSIARILTNIGAEAQAKQIKELRDSETPHQGAPSPLGSWWQHAEPHEDIKKGGFDESTFAAKLDDVVAGVAPPEYQRAEEFFAKTYLTRELGGLLKDTLRRLAGSGGEAVVQLRTPFGGGKTHTLIALYHLVKSAADIEDRPDIRALLNEAGLDHIPHARTAVAVGDVTPVQAHDVGEGVTVHTLWGALAHQLGGAEGYALLRESDEARVSPSKDTLRALFAQYGKVLILLDELLLYQVRAGAITVGESSLRAQTFSFLQTLTELVGSMPGVALVTTFPESHIEYYEHDQAELVFDTLGKIFGRVESTRVPVQGEEIFEVVRRRLFSKVSERQAKQVVAAFQALYEQHAGDLPEHVRSGAYAERMRRAYPFHPEVIDVLYERWGTMQTFQKTRGVLRLLARVIEHQYMSPAAGSVISLADVGLDDADLRGAIAQILRGGNWEPVMASDIVPPSGKAYQIDKERGGEYARQRLCQGVTTAIFMYSHSGGGERGAQEARLRLALLQPQGVTPTLMSDALSRLKGRLYYLYSNGSWSFKVQPNLNAVLNAHMAQIKARDIDARLREALAGRAGSGTFKVIVWPDGHRELPDNTQLKLVLLPPEVTPDDPDDLERVRFTLQSSHASGPRLNKNTVLYASGKRAEFVRARNVGRELLALELVASETSLTLSDDQKRELQDRLARARELLPDTIKAAYTVVFEPVNAKANEYRLHDISAQVKTSPTLSEALSTALREADALLDALDPALLTGEYFNLWPADEPTIKLRDLRDYFHRFPHLPYLAHEDVLRESIVHGVKNGLFEVALKQDESYPQVWRRANAPAPQDFFFADHYLLARPGVIPKPEPTPAGENEQKGATGGTSPGRSSAGSTEPDPIPPPPGRTTTWVQLRFQDLATDQLPKLVDVSYALEDAQGKVSIAVNIQAENPEGLNESTLELNVKELLLQHGLDPEWEKG